MNSDETRICQVLYSFEIGGSERLAEQLCPYFVEAGVSVDVCATRSGFGVISHRLEKSGHSCLALDLENYPRPIRPFRRRKLGKWLRRRGISSLLVHHLAMLLDVYPAARSAGIKNIVVAEHTAELLRMDHQFREMAQRALQLPVKFVAVNPDVQSALEEIRPALKGQVKVIRNGVDTRRFRPGHSALKASEDCVEICWVGRLHPVKDIQTAVRAFEEACRLSTAELRLTIVGDGQDRARLERAIEGSEQRESISYLGQRDEVNEIMQSMDLLLISSTEEGTPLTMLEAMSCGLPIVSTDVGGIPEVVSDDIGILVKPKDVSGMAAAIARLAEQRELRESMGEAARRLVVSSYAIGKSAAEYLELLEIGNAPRSESQESGTDLGQ